MIETLFENPWLSVKKVVEPDKGVNGYVFSHEARCGGHIVAILPFRECGDGWEYLLRFEITPCWSMLPELSAITGGCEGEVSPRSCVEDAVRELEEEAGYTVSMNHIRSLGRCRGTKSCDTIYHLFSVDVSGLEQKEAKGDGSRLESEADVFWVNDPWNCVDPMVCVMYVRLNKGEVKP